MSTAELGISLAEMIRAGKIHAICCTGANLEEDVFNLVAHSHYERVPHYRDLTPADEQALLDRHLNRVTDTCIPEEEAMRRIERIVLEGVDGAPTQRASGCSRTSSCTACCAPARSSRSSRSIRRTAGCWPPSDANLPIFVPGWEDSTLGNVFAAHCLAGRIKSRAHDARAASST